MVSRYSRREIGINRTSQYKNIIEGRGRKQIDQYFTPNLRHPSEVDALELNLIGHEWSEGDKFYKLASRFYGDPTLWWIIAWYNQTPTESHLKRGDVVNIPLPLERILEFLDV